MTKKNLLPYLAARCAAMCLVWPATAFAWQADALFVRATPVAGNVVMLDTTGGFGGGNIAVLAGKDGIVLVDSMLAATAPKVQAALAKLSDQPVRYLIHTHFHGDHSGGATVLGRGATLVSHANLRARFLDPKRSPVSDAALPAVTLAQGMTLYANGEKILITHYPSGHTDNDLVVYFTQAKVAHLGDMFFFGMFPAVYTSGGGDIRQLIINLEQIAAGLPVDAKVIPGHGAIASVDEFRGYIAMLKETTAIVDEALRRGQTLQQSKEANILSKYDALGSGGAQTTDQYLAMLYGLLAKK